MLKRTGDDMNKRYKETALGGLAEEFQDYDANGLKRTLQEKLQFENQMISY